MSQQPEQNKTAQELKMNQRREIIKKRIIVNDSNMKHIAASGVINGTCLVGIEDAMEEYASQQTASLQKQVEELKGEGVNYMLLMTSKVQHQKERIAQLEEALKDLLNHPLPIYATRKIRKALNPIR